MAHAPAFGFGAGLDIVIRTKRRYSYSFIETAALKIGDDILEVSSWGDYSYNGVVNALLPPAMGDLVGVSHEVISEKESLFTIDAGHGITILVSAFKDIVSVEAIYPGDSAVASQWLGNSTGLMGSFEGQMVARDGTTVIEDPNDFGQEWQVLDR